MLQAAGDISPRLSVFTGPLYTKLDQFVNDYRIPSAFWKVVALRDPTAEGEDLSALGFLMKQNELWDDFNGSKMLDLRLYQVGIADIGRYTGIEFGELAMLDEFEWQQPRFRDRTYMQPITIDGADDIRFFGDRRRARGIRSLRIGQPSGEASALGASAASHPGSCGCTGHVASTDERVDALAAQVTALSDVIDALLATQPQGEDENRMMHEARQVHARIVGGEMTGTDEFPECACIGDNGNWFCSGVLIHERVVLTAAHCAPDIDRVYLNGRTINLAGAVGEVVPVERAIIHPEYDPSRVPSHDLAVLILAQAAKTTPIEIATEDEVNREDDCTLVGFGYDHPSAPTGFGTKRKVNVPLTSLSGMSESEIENIESLHGFDALHELHAGRKHLGKDSCNGDSGGPAYIFVDNGYKLAGITSRAAFSSTVNCGDGGIYTRVTPYLAWLARMTDGLVGTVDDGPPPTTPGQLYISAAQPNPNGTDRGNEWVELTNGERQDIQLDPYTLADRQGGKHALAGLLSAGATHRAFIPADSPLQLGNGGDEIILLHNNQERQRVSYTSAGAGEVIQFQMPIDPDKPDEPDDGCSGGGNNPSFPEADPC